MSHSIESHFVECITRELQWYIYLAFHNALVILSFGFSQVGNITTPTSTATFYENIDGSVVTGPLTERLPEILAKLRMHLLRSPYSNCHASIVVDVTFYHIPPYLCILWVVEEVAEVFHLVFFHGESFNSRR